MLQMKRTSSSRSSVKPKEDSASELFEAVMAGKISEVKRLVEKGAKVNSQKRDGFTPLMLAAFQGNEKVVEYLIGRGSDVNLRNYIGQSALMIAAKSGRNPIVDLLVLARADVRAVDNENRNAIAWAVSYADFPETVSKLAVIGADYDHQDA